MQTTLSKLLLSKLSRRLHRLPKTSIGGRCAPGISFSTSRNPGRPVRGERGGDDSSEDPFLRSLSFGNDDKEENQRSYQEASFGRPSSRPACHGGKERRKVPPLA
ncbi:hypothetical protein ZIOFF_023398 [Zingiber officinale]|uniref:Uncharacterized protein n=1 Tax=Zingiber officinale TaxID=94328 RepID=A0A8J5LCH2_ZINOF|nr:hypothetical protein ZIOFF_023398 [Zingiber officinale]